jgi:hypothetical protein
MDIESVVQYNTDMVQNACMQVPISWESDGLSAS